MPRPEPLLGHPVPEYPTPIISNTIETEIVRADQGKYSAIVFGTRYNEVDHGQFPKDLPDHVLVYDAPVDNDGKLRKRLWVNNRTDQELYNFQVDYEGNDSFFPIYTRVYVTPRDGYTPLLPLSDDPVDSYAKLISEQVLNQTEPPELSNQFVKVVRIYHTLPGKIAFNITFPYGGLTNFPSITTKQKVASGYVIPCMPGGSCPVDGYQDAHLVTQVINQSENGNIDELKVVYEITPPASSQTGFGYSVGYTNGDKDFPNLTWNFSVERDLYAPAADLSACPITGFTSLILVDQKMTGDPSQDQVVKVERRYETLPGPVIIKVDYDNGDVDYPIVKTTQRKTRASYVAGTAGTDACPVAGYAGLVLFEQHLAATEFVDVVDDQKVFERTPNSIITTRSYDTELNVIITTTRQKIVPGVVPVPTLLTIDLEEQPIDKWRTLQIISTLSELPAEKVEFRTGKFPFPTLLTGIQLFKVELTSATNSEVIWYPNTLRPLQNVPAVFRVTTSFFTAAPPSVNIFSAPTRDLYFRGRSFQISITNVLNDAITLSATFTGDTNYGDLTEGITFAATNPSATDYYNAIGTYQVVGCDITRYRGGIWTMQLTEVVLA